MRPSKKGVDRTKWWADSEDKYQKQICEKCGMYADIYFKSLPMGEKEAKCSYCGYRTASPR